MVNIRKITGKEAAEFWKDRYGQRAGEAPMVSRVRGQSSFGSQGTAGYNINQDSDTLGNNILIHSIHINNTTDDDDAVMEILDNRTSTTTMTDIRFRILVNRQTKHNSQVNVEFPIPILCVNGGRIWKDDSTVNGPQVSICFTVIESTGDIDPHNDIFLQSVNVSGSSNTDVIDDADVEVYGVYINTTAVTTGTDTYAQCSIKNGAGSNRGVIYINESWVKETGDEELDSSRQPQWFPYPVYLKDGMQLQNTSSGTTSPYTTVFYRKVNGKGIDHGWT